MQIKIDPIICVWVVVVAFNSFVYTLLSLSVSRVLSLTRSFFLSLSLFAAFLVL